ncbi:hypothetical protein Patl1_24911 [Pistacia atlantica]|uniref:Uncharacterized protein n=1 Tax=Pistacia atlantica TaxID=434234 RepID=A0ACC1B146_9ROSI|nr:hypothetical protein Patl1_24911 [Pistacia atlantica]
MASSSTPSIKSSLGSSKSAFLQHGFSLQSVTFLGFFMKARSFGIFARVATEKTLYDFTVKKEEVEEGIEEAIGYEKLGNMRGQSSLTCLLSRDEDSLLWTLSMSLVREDSLLTMAMPPTSQGGFLFHFVTFLLSKP